MTNRLAQSSSPYLLLHANQNIDWWPWGFEAWEEARRRDVPVLVSLGYYSCHWCHVMRSECFDNPQVADLLNQNFVSIKVDRQEYPQVDAAFTQTTLALTGQGGWPNTVFCTPDGKPFFAGTYFPAQAQDEMPGFVDVLQALTDAWRNRRSEVQESAASITAQLAITESDNHNWDLHQIRAKVLQNFDPINGGFGTTPKFPQPTLLDALMVTGEPTELEQACFTLEAMARGGIHDQLGGGFHRYSVDASWAVPHFEKMLCDNALLLGSYTSAWRRTPDHDPARRTRMRNVVEDIVDWLKREMRLENGAFAASLDSESTDMLGMPFEGIYYLWNPELLDDVLGSEDSLWAQKVFHVTEAGNMLDGLSTLMTHGNPDPAKLAEVKTKLLAERAKRFPPAREEVVIAAWNGYLVANLARAAMIFSKPEWLQLATECAQALWAMWDGKQLKRRWSSDESTVEAENANTNSENANHIQPPNVIAGGLEDYAAVAWGFMQLASATGVEDWAKRALILLECAQSQFFIQTLDGITWQDQAVDKNLFWNAQTQRDSATPAPAAVFVTALRSAGLWFDRKDFVELAAQILHNMYPEIAKHPQHCGWGLQQAMIVDEARRGLQPAVVTVYAPDPMDALCTAVWRMAPDGSVIKYVKNQNLEHQPTQVIVCRKQQCFEPASELSQVKELLWRRC